MKKYIRVISIITLLLALFLEILVIGWSFYPYDIITIENSEAIKVDKTTYKVGDRITYTFDYCLPVQRRAMVSRYLVNSVRISFTEMVANTPVGCDTVTNNDLVIPDYVDPGVYHIETTGEYQVNPLRTIDIHWRSVDFQIIK